MFSRRFRGSCRNPDEVHGTLTARRQFPIHFSVGTDPDKKVPTLPRDRPTSKDKGLYGCCSTRSMHGKLRLPAIHVSSRATHGRSVVRLSRAPSLLTAAEILRHILVILRSWEHDFLRATESPASPLRSVPHFGGSAVLGARFAEGH